MAIIIDQLPMITDRLPEFGKTGWLNGAWHYIPQEGQLMTGAACIAGVHRDRISHHR